MNRIEALLQALQNGKKQFDAIMDEGAYADGSTPAFAAEEYYDLREETGLGPADADGVQMDLFTMPGSGLIRPEEDDGHELGRIAAGDNLDYMVWLLREKGMAGKIQLIYVDPPFFTGARYQSSVQIESSDGRKSPVLKVGAYEDRWEHDLGAYLEMLAVRFFLMRELLTDSGCLWVHLDWHGSHYVKMMLDEIFGPDHFINEVAWTYKSGGASKRSFARKHDTLLFYSRTDHYKFRPLKEKSYNREGKPYHFKGVEEFEDEHGWYTMVNMKDVWSIDMVGRTSGERMGYATQKPEKLLERIIDACTDEGDLCADFFAGTGTLGAVCSRRNRPWILCDEGKPAIASQILRMARLGKPFLVERPVEDRIAGDAERLDDTRMAEDTEAPNALEASEAAMDTVAPEARASVETEISDGMLRLVRCRPDLTQMRERDRETAAEYISADSLDLVSFWSVDTDYDGKVHTGRRLLQGTDAVLLPEADAMKSGETARADKTARTGAPAQEEMTLVKEMAFGEKAPQARISIVGYDLLGGRFAHIVSR